MYNVCTWQEPGYYHTGTCKDHVTSFKSSKSKQLYIIKRKKTGMGYIYKAFHTYHYLSLKIDYGFKDNQYSLFQKNVSQQTIKFKFNSNSNRRRTWY